MTQPSVISIGKYDGVHKGHQAVFSTARQMADRCGARVVALAFDPHPNVILDPENQPPRLCRTEEKIARLKQIGVDEVVILKPTPQLLEQTPQTFINSVIEQYHPIAFVQGKDFRFGHDRTGDIPMLQDLGKVHGFEVVTQPSVDVTFCDLSVVHVHSSVIRWLVGQGRIEDAHRCLGIPFSLRSPVVKGEQRGRTIGFPTVNLDLDPLFDHMIPADGVYAGYVTIDGSQVKHPAAISVGTKPSFDTFQLTVEAHLPGFSRELYGQTITMAFTRWLRDQMRFPSVDALCEQLARDVERVKQNRSLTPVTI